MNIASRATKWIDKLVKPRLKSLTSNKAKKVAAALCIFGPGTAFTIPETRSKITVKAGANSLDKIKNRVYNVHRNPSGGLYAYTLDILTGYPLGYS